MKILMIYASQSVYQNTKLLADKINSYYEQEGIHVDMYTFKDLPKDIDFNSYDHIDFGMYTWDNGTIPMEGRELYEELNSRLSNSNVLTTSCFGTGDTFYPNFCGALDLYKQRLEPLTKFIGLLRIESRFQKSDETAIKAYALSNITKR